MMGTQCEFQSHNKECTKPTTLSLWRSYVAARGRPGYSYRLQGGFFFFSSLPGYPLRSSRAEQTHRSWCRLPRNLPVVQGGSTARVRHLRLQILPQSRHRRPHHNRPVLAHRLHRRNRLHHLHHLPAILSHHHHHHHLHRLRLLHPRILSPRSLPSAGREPPLRSRVFLARP